MVHELCLSLTVDKNVSFCCRYDVRLILFACSYDVPDARALVKYKKEWSKSSVTCVLPEDGKCT